MSAWRALALALAALAPLACTGPRAPDRPAVLAAQDSAGRAEVARVAAMAAGVTSVTLREDALAASSVLVLERRAPGGSNGAAATGRTLEGPVTLELVLRRARCMLVRSSDGSAYELREARCLPAP
jgi:hypothetical protein